jgi:hypothetical protein
VDDEHVSDASFNHGLSKDETKLSEDSEHLIRVSGMDKHTSSRGYIESVHQPVRVLLQPVAQALENLSFRLAKC